MKNKILITSVILTTIASSIAIVTTATLPEIAPRLYSISFFIGLASIGTFLVGMVFPKENRNDK